MLGDVERDLDELVGLGEVGVKGVEPAVRGGELDVEAFRLGAEHVDWDRIVVVGFEELALATFDALFRVLDLLPFGVRVGAKLLETVPEERFEVTAEVGRETDAVVEVLDEVFCVLDLDGAEGAVGALGVSEEA